MSLTVCCLAGEPPAQVAAVLAPFRPIANDVFVAVDSRIDPATLAPYDDVADRVVRYEFGLHPDRARPWLFAQCHGDWIFYIDGDEVVSPALIDALPSLLTDEHTMQFGFPRRWLFPAADHWLGELPWYPDMQVRLVRNGPLVHHSGRLHDRLRPVQPARDLDLPIYHLALLTAPEDERRTRGERYEQHARGQIAYGGGLLNHTMYVPEDTATAPPAEVPAVDQPWIDAVLAGRDAAIARREPTTPLPLATRAEIERHVDDPGTTEPQGSIEVFAEYGHIAPGEVRPLYVTVTNTGDAAWPWDPEADPRIAVGYRWWTEDGEELADDHRHTPMSATVRPGSSLLLAVMVEAPRRPGRYRLRLDLVHEFVRWFQTPADVEMEVSALRIRPTRPAAPMAVTTIVARNYLPRARLLARSFLSHNPTGRMTVLVIDADGHERTDGLFEVLTLEDLPLTASELRRMVFMYDVTELATAVKPFLLSFLLFDRGEQAVTYLDPDIEVFAPIDDLDQLARRHGIVLSPHRLEPVPDDGCQPDAGTLSLAGAFNLGFIAVGHASREFLERWAAHCRTNCVIAQDDGFFVDQRWVDAGVVPYAHHILRDPGCNVAYWNLDARPITDEPDGKRAGGWPLRFFHYSGFDERTPHVLSKHQGDRPRTLLSAQPALRELLDGLAARLRAEASADERALPYGWGTTPAGLAIDNRMRRAFRDEVVRRERDADKDAPSVDELPDFLAQSDDRELLEFLSTAPAGSDQPRVGRYLRLVHRARRDVSAAFPDLTTSAGIDDYFTWLRTYGRAEESIPAPLIPPADPAPAERPPLRRGVNVVGYFTAELGVGEGGRGMLATLAELGEPRAVVNETTTSNRQHHRLDERWSEAVDYDVNILCVNSDQTPRVVDRLGDRLRPDQYTVGMWAWELEEFPPAMHGGVPYVDEIWLNSGHAAAAVARVVDVPVHVVLPTVQQYPMTRGGPHPLGIDADFSFLFCFDVNSWIERKNPEAVVRAFREAFKPDAGPTLIIKSHNGHFDQLELERLRYEARDRNDIHIIDAVLDVGELRRLIATCGCYVSLHRAEGFGYTMAEAMLAGVPVVATRYSGNLEFMDDENSFLVDAGRGAVPETWGPYPAGAIWAEPDVDDAARLMRLVYDDTDRRKVVAERGRRDIEQLHSPRARAPLVAARLAAIRSHMGIGEVVERPSASTTAVRMAWRAARQLAQLGRR